MPTIRQDLSHSRDSANNVRPSVRQVKLSQAPDRKLPANGQSYSMKFDKEEANIVL